MKVSYKQQSHYEFALEFLRLADKQLYQPDAEHLTITVNHPTLGRLLQRIGSERQVVVLPNLRSSRWLITGPTLDQMDRTRLRLRHFLVPTYATFNEKRARPLSFEDTNRLYQLGAQLYPIGFYVLQSQKEYTSDIFRLLDIWMQLEQERPAPQSIEVIPTYSVLYERFQLALAANQWDEAEQLRREVRRLNLTTADNLIFLEVELLARQQRWRDIWQRNDYADLARVPVPRAVRAALLTAFHQVILLPEEQQGNWQNALAEFDKQRASLGLLLTARLGIAQGPVVKVFAYLAAQSKNREELQELITASNDPSVLECIKQLLRLLGSEKKTSEEQRVPHDALHLAREAFADENYDVAARYAEQIDDVEKKLVLLMQIPFYTRDTALAERALLLYWDLPEEQQARIQQRHSFIPSIYADLLQQVSPERVMIDVPAIQSLSIETWIDWFLNFLDRPDDPVLAPALDNLAKITDERFWTPERITALNNLLFQIVAQDALVTLPLVRDALRRLIEFFLNDQAFPRAEHIYQELYDNLYAALLAKHARDEMPNAFVILRLADAILRVAPGKCSTISSNLEKWCGEPLPKLELWVLEVFDMLIDYGLEPGRLSTWCRGWMEWLLYKQPRNDRPRLLTWRVLAQVIQPGEDLLHVLDQRLSVQREDEATDIISMLPDSYRITIYSLHEASANRAKLLLLERNRNLDVRICTDEVSTSSAKALAKNADLVVLATTAMTHALFYGISPALESQKVVYPQLRGANGIVGAIEAYLQGQLPGEVQQ